MSSNPRNILKSFARMDRERKDDDLIKYQLKVLGELAPLLELDMNFIRTEFSRMREDRPEDFMSAVKGHRVGQVPPEFFIEKGGKTLFADLALRAHESKWFERFKQLASIGGSASAALVFPVLGRKNWIIHNLPVAPEPGVARIVIPSNIHDVDDVHVTSLAQFIKEYGGLEE